MLHKTLLNIFPKYQGLGFKFKNTNTLFITVSGFEMYKKTDKLKILNRLQLRLLI